MRDVRDRWCFSASHIVFIGVWSYNFFMVRKYILFLLIPFLFIACASDPAPVVSSAPAAPVVKPAVVEVPNPKISIDKSKPDMISISVSYTADAWAFITGIELKNGAGEIKKYTFKKPYHKVLENGRIMEICTYTCQNLDIPPVVHYYADELREFLAVGDITARPIADNEHFSFMPVVFD